tara:strand:+ start:1265 stop:1735 length:471 start_codon:yes stop_codon:yes gene_type:complete
LSALKNINNEQILNILRNQDHTTVTILSSLLSVQDEIGYLPKNSINVIADFMNVTTNDVWGVASYYLNFRFEPPGQHTIEICWGPSCHIRGASKLQSSVLKKLKLKNQGDTSDGKFTLKFNTCLGACPQAPLISIDHKLSGKMNSSRLLKMLDQLN